MGSAWRRVTIPLGVLAGRAWRVAPEFAVSLALVLGWALITLAVSRLWRADVVAPLSAGVFFLSLVGWRLLLTVVRDGLYALTQEKR